MLRRLYIDNYRCLVNFQLELRELTLLVGPNGSGKSSVLDVLFGLRKLLMGLGRVNDPDVFPARTLTRWQSRRKQEIKLTVDLDGDGDLTYHLEVEHDPDHRRARVSSERLTEAKGPLFEFNTGEVQLYRDNHSGGPRYSADWSESALARVAPRPDNKRLTAFLEFVRGVSICALNPKAFATESPTEERVLAPDGSNFASWYRHQLQERPELTYRLVEVLRKVIDGFHSMQMESVGSETRALTLTSHQGGQECRLKLDELSDGQRAMIALYALLHLSTEKDVLLIDEPDNYLALAEIQPWLMALSDACGRGPRQAVICSHHPEAYDYMGADAGVLLKRESAGVVTARPLKEVLASQAGSGLKLSEIVARGWEL
jgi:predicted ATPase